jgi:hypothetical protein
MDEEVDSGDDLPSNDMFLCAHRAHDSDWLPLLKGKSELTLAPHPYCERCGLVRNIGPDRPRKLGYYTDVLNALEEHLENEHKKGGKHKLIEAQKRLIVKRMQEDELFQDLYGVLASSQEERFIEIVKEIRPDLERNEIEYYLQLG